MRGPDLGEKYIGVGNLQRLLAEMPPDMFLMGNTVGNLAIFEQRTDGLLYFMGYIDLGSEKFEIWEPDAVDTSPSGIIE